MADGSAMELPRVRLHQRIEDATGLVVVWGPSGAGKSVLVRHWFNSHVPVDSGVWVDPPAEGSDPGGYWLAIDALINTGSAPPSILVLDLPDQLADHAGWDRLDTLRAALSGLKVIVIVRDASFFWEHLGQSADMTIVRPAELQFTEQEIEELFGAAGLTLPRRYFRALAADAAGHAALIARDLRTARLFGADLEIDSVSVVAARDRMNHEYVERELLETDSLQHFTKMIVTLGCARMITDPVANALCGSDAIAALPVLERAGVLVRFPSADGFGLKFVRPVRRTLARMARIEGSGALDLAMASFARDRIQEGDAVAALWYATAAEDWPLVTEILGRSWFEVVAADLKVVGRALSRIPPAVIADSPALRSARSVFLLLGPGPAVYTGLVVETREDLLVVGEDYPASEALLAGTARSIALRQVGAFEGAVALDAELDALAEQWASETDDLARPTFEPNLPLLQSQWGLSNLLYGEHVRAAELFRRAYRASGDRSSGFVSRNSAGLLALHYAMLGEPSMAQRWIESEGSLGGSGGWLEAMVRVPALTARALSAVDRLELDAAAADLADLGEIRDDLELWPFVVYTRSLLDLHRGDAEIGLDRLRRMRSTFARWETPSSFARPLLQAAGLELRTAAGLPLDARQRATLEGPELHPLVRVARARASLLTGQPYEALTDCAALEGQYGGYTRVRLDALVIAVQALIETGGVERGVTTWNRAVALAQDTGLVRPISTVCPDVLAVLAQEGAQMLEIGQSIPGFTQVQIYGTQATPVDLTVREQTVLGQIGVGHTVAAMAKLGFVSPNTIKSQLRSLYRKLGVHTRQEAVDEARRRGLI